MMHMHIDAILDAADFCMFYDHDAYVDYDFLVFSCCCLLVEDVGWCDTLDDEWYIYFLLLI